MTSLRRLLGLPRLPLRVYALILTLLLVLAYIITGPMHGFFTKFRSSLGTFYEPSDSEREEFLKRLEQPRQ